MDEDFGDALLPGLPEAATAPGAEAQKASSSSAPDKGKRSVGTTSSSGEQNGKAAAAETAQGLLQETSADPAAVEIPEPTVARVEGERSRMASSNTSFGGMASTKRSGRT